MPDVRFGTGSVTLWPNKRFYPRCASMITPPLPPPPARAADSHRFTARSVQQLLAFPAFLYSDPPTWPRYNAFLPSLALFLALRARASVVHRCIAALAGDRFYSARTNWEGPFGRSLWQPLHAITASPRFSKFPNFFRRNRSCTRQTHERGCNERKRERGVRKKIIVVAT